MSPKGQTDIVTPKLLTEPKKIDVICQIMFGEGFLYLYA